MSDISTNLSMKSPMFTMDEILTCSIFNMKLLFYVIMFIICILCMSSCLNLLFASDNDEELYRMNRRNRMRMYNQECFSNDDFYSYKDTINKGYFTYQNASLTSPTNNLIAGQAKRYTYPGLNNTGAIYILDIFANLYILNGNPFGKEDIKISDLSYKHKYIVYLKQTKNNNRLNIGQLIRDGDSIYKLKFKSEDINKYVDFNEIEIVYLDAQNKEKVILSGKFTLL